MAKKKADLIEEAKALGLEVSEKMTIAEINEAIKGAEAAEIAEEIVEAVEVAEKFAKSGKRSKKHAEEVAEKEAKEARKAAGDTTPLDGSEAIVKKGPKPITRPRIERRGKKYQEVAKKVDFVYLIGDNAQILIDDMEKVNYKNYKNLETVENVILYLKENIDFGKDQTVLFSPATSSFCQFKSFEHRGKVFKELTVKILGK